MVVLITEMAPKKQAIRLTENNGFQCLIAFVESGFIVLSRKIMTIKVKK